METYESLLSAVTAEAGDPSTDPATDELIGLAPRRTPADLDLAVTAAREAQEKWAELGHARRCELLLAAADAIDDSADALAELISREQGKPLDGAAPSAAFEAGACAAWLRATAAIELEPQVVVDDGETRAVLEYRPAGVVGAIGPWNWPAMIAIWQIAPALRMGNTVVVKPSEFTPLSVLAVGEILNRVLPPGVLQVLSGGRELGAAFSSHQGFAKLMFTGSTPTGKAIARAAADNLARVTLELGGNDAGIVLPDVDPNAIAEDLFWGAFINTGQTCAALKRLYVHEDVYDAVCEALLRVARSTRSGHGVDAGVTLGPLTTAAQFDVVDRLVEDARLSGARILIGGEPDRAAPGNFYPATLVADIAPDRPLVTEEQFGPALPIVRFREVDEAVALANAGGAGLGGSVWSADVDAARAIAARLRTGTVWINRHGAVHPMVPFGGVGASGYGLEFGVEGLKSVAVPQVING